MVKTIIHSVQDQDLVTFEKKKREALERVEKMLQEARNVFIGDAFSKGQETERAARDTYKVIERIQGVSHVLVPNHNGLGIVAIPYFYIEHTCTDEQHATWTTRQSIMQ
jgi:hypothetical protein